jgi:molybdopterin converting factor subunit 1
MQVRVLFFGLLKDLAGRPSDSLSLPDNATLADVLLHYESRIPSLKDWSGSLAMSINQQYADPETRLKPGDEVALLPPVSGGSEADDEPSAGESGPTKVRAAIVRVPIETQSIVDSIKRPEDGALAWFEGTVRNHSRGRRTLYLEYEAYEGMALEQMDTLAREALAQFAVRDVRIVHRLGRLEIGETSVLIVVASAHRAPAFAAGRWLIDTLKRTVPIWKKEHFEDGAVWADGDPFPPQLSRSPGTPGQPGASKRKAP